MSNWIAILIILLSLQPAPRPQQKMNLLCIVQMSRTPAGILILFIHFSYIPLSLTKPISQYPIASSHAAISPADSDTLFLDTVNVSRSTSASGSSDFIMLIVREKPPPPWLLNGIILYHIPITILYRIVTGPNGLK